MFGRGCLQQRATLLAQRPLADQDEPQAVTVGASAPEAQESPYECGLVFDCLHPTYGTDHERIFRGKTLWPARRSGPGPRMKTLRVHAVANLCDTLGAGTNCVYKPACQVAAYGRVLVDEGTNYSPEQVVFAVRAVEVVHVTPVLTMDSPGYSSKKSVYLPLQRSQIPRVQYVRTKTAEQAEEPPIGGKVSARTSVQ